MTRRRTVVKHPGLIAGDVPRWAAFANSALHFVTDGQTTESRLRGLLKLAKTCQPLGAGGEVNPCVRLREEVERLLDPPFVPYRLRAGVDMEAMAASNRVDVERFAREVIARCQSFVTVQAAERQG